jgi:hypothetical protein
MKTPDKANSSRCERGDMNRSRHCAVKPDRVVIKIPMLSHPERRPMTERVERAC